MAFAACSASVLLLAVSKSFNNCRFSQFLISLSNNNSLACSLIFLIAPSDKTSVDLLMAFGGIVGVYSSFNQPCTFPSLKLPKPGFLDSIYALHSSGLFFKIATKVSVSDFSKSSLTRCSAAN
ncbi:Uncharacterised protein [Legionella pneumophila]|nr:Uncharacterised protein [Legionella pneumophila]